ncbi:MAG: hypothetical protein ABSF35_10280 [Polyangia bacterium]|jgi:hypothetical protein
MGYRPVVHKKWLAGVIQLYDGNSLGVRGLAMRERKDPMKQQYQSIGIEELFGFLASPAKRQLPVRG